MYLNTYLKFKIQQIIKNPPYTLYITDRKTISDIRNECHQFR